MSNFITPKVRLSFPTLFSEEERQLRVLERQCAQWRSGAAAANPGKSAELILNVQRDMLRRANKLAELGPMSNMKIVDYFLKVTSRWLLGGTPVEKIMEMLPKTLDDLGYMIIKEGAPDSGQKLTATELKRASARGGKILQ